MKSFIITLTQLLLLREAASFTVLSRASGGKPLAMVSRDEYMRPHFHAPSSPVTEMDRISQCAQADIECSVEEMTEMIQDLERLNESCQGNMSIEECDLDSVEARETSKQALAWRKDAQESGHRGEGDHSYNHFVDYRSIGEYESH